MSGQLEGNLLQFGRVLRAAGLPIGTGQILDAMRAVDAVGVETREGIYWALAACFVKRREELTTFDEAFTLFFRDHADQGHYLRAMVDASQIPRSARPRDLGSRRVRDAMARRGAEPAAPTKAQERLDFDVTMAASTAETLRTRDFEKMSADEVRAAHEAIRRMSLHSTERTERTRRLGPDPRGLRFDLRRTLRATLREGRDSIPLRFRGYRTRPPAIVALCDVSGSMERYSRMVLHFLHALTRSRPRVSSFVFGTRLTNVTRWLRERDVDQALAAVGREVSDWAGGTRIGESLRVFNRVWSRRVLAHGAATVLLVTDGLERGDAELLRVEAERLHKSCRRLIWLNPLLRYEAFEPRAAGVRALVEHVDDFRAVHHLASLDQLAAVL